MTPRTSQTGLSLLELLVVLVIIGLVSSLLMQGLGFGLSLFERVHTRGELAKQQLLEREWFRRVNETLIAWPADARVSLAGDSMSFRSTSLSPLLGTSGIPQNVFWHIDDGTVWYEESDVALPLISVSVNTSFSYRNHEGRWVSDWPPDANSEALPAAIAFDDAGEKYMVAALRVRTKPDLLLEDSRRGRE